MVPDSGEYLAADFGAARVGLARGSSQARLAEPLMSVAANEASDSLMELADKYRAAGIVIGLPRGLDGQDTPQTHTVKRWAEQTKQKINLPFYWQDEALTSRQAAGKIVNRKRKMVNGPDEHALAAAIILQDFLGTPVKNRVEI